MITAFWRSQSKKKSSIAVGKKLFRNFLGRCILNNELINYLFQTIHCAILVVIWLLITELLIVYFR